MAVNYSGPDIPMWLCVFQDGVPIMCSVATTKKGAYKAARSLLGAGSWLEVRAKGIRVKRVMLVAPSAQ